MNFFANYKMKIMKENRIQYKTVQSFGMNFSLDERVAGLGGDTTHVLISLHPEISFLAPVCAPAVLQQPELLLSFRAGAVAHHQDTVV